MELNNDDTHVASSLVIETALMWSLAKRARQRNHLNAMNDADLRKVGYVRDPCHAHNLCGLEAQVVKTMATNIREDRARERQQNVNSWTAWGGGLTALTALAGLFLGVLNYRRGTQTEEPTIESASQDATNN